MFTSGNENIGINIQSGNSAKKGAVVIGNTTNPTFGTVASPENRGWNLSMINGTGNVGIKNNQYAESLTIINNTSDNKMRTSFPFDGVMRIHGISAAATPNTAKDPSKSVMFANLGYVKSGTLQLDAIEMQGSYSVAAAFLNNGYRENVPATAPGTDGKTGIWTDAGTGIRLQGVIGSNGSLPGLNSEYSVGVYANTGQQDMSLSDYGITTNTATKSGNLKINDLQIALNQNANNSVLIYANRGTHVDVHENNYPGANSENISDGGWTDNGTVKWGYETPDKVSSYNSIIAYADGYYNGAKHGYA